MNSLIVPASEKIATDSPEIKLLLCCARTQIDDIIAGEIQKLLKQELDWKKLIQWAGYHKLLPLLFSHLRTTGSELIPPKQLTQLQSWVHINTAFNLRLTHELLKLLELFSTHQIPAVPFKGPVLASLVYGNLALRQFHDLDVLIHQADIIKVKQLLVEEGYTICVPAMSMTKAQQALHLQANCEYRFLRQDGKVAIEPHWNITSRKYSIGLNPEDLWQRLNSEMLLNQTIPTFAPEDLLFILCLNGYKDHWQKLNRICDVAELLRANPEINWNWLMYQTQKWGCQRLLLLGLTLAQELLGTELPNLVCNSIQQDPTVKSLAQQVQEQLFVSHQNHSPRFQASNFSIWELQVRERLRDRVGYCCNLVFKPNEGDAGIVELPSWLYFIYYLIRPLRLIMRRISKYSRFN